MGDQCSRNFKMTSPLLSFICALLLSTVSFFASAQTCDSAASRLAVSKLHLIESLPIKRGSPFEDVHARKIIELGRCTSSLLVAQLNNRNKSKVAHLFEYRIGQVALSLLASIHEPPHRPCPDGSCPVKAKFGDFRDEVNFFSKPANRAQLKKSWAAYIQQE